MSAAAWWERRRFGLMVDVSMATVPAWAPVGQEAAWYHAHVDGSTHDVNLQPSPLAESLQHHQDRWAHVEHYDDFFPLLHFESFDPDEWVAIARDAGIGYLVMTAKHHDGLCWWDAPGTDRTVLHDGPARNVFGQLAEACERAELPLGAAYSLLDWGDPRYPSAAYVDDVLHPQVLDLVERYGIATLRGEAQWGAGGSHWRSDELHARVRSLRPDIVIDDRWWADRADVTTFEQCMPRAALDRSWEFRRPLGASACHNRAEPDHVLMTPPQVVAVLTEAVAKGGHFLLQVGPDESGLFPERTVERLRAVGGWVRRNQRLIDEGRPWSEWGDDDARMIELDGELYAIDSSGAGRFRALVPSHGRVRSLETSEGTAVGFDQDESGVRLQRPPRKSQRMPMVYRVGLEPPAPAPIALFPDTLTEPAELAPLLADASPGEIVQLGDGVYVGPARVPDGVTLRGLGPDRTTIDGRESDAVTLGVGSRLEHCHATGGGKRLGRLPVIAVRLAGRESSVVGCMVDGHIEVAADRGRVLSCGAFGVVAGTATPVDRVEVVRSTFRGIGTDVGVDIAGGSNHHIDGCEIHDHLIAISLVGTVGASVRHNRLRARWWGVRLVDCDTSEVSANKVEHTMRAVDVDGGSGAVVTGNAASDGDSGCVVQNGAASTEVTGNFWERCRLGLLLWEAVAVRERDNTAVGLGELDGARRSGP